MEPNKFPDKPYGFRCTGARSGNAVILVVLLYLLCWFLEDIPEDRIVH